MNKLVRWHDAGFPPINLNKNIPALVELIHQNKNMTTTLQVALHTLIDKTSSDNPAVRLIEKALKEAGV